MSNLLSSCHRALSHCPACLAASYFACCCRSGDAAPCQLNLVSKVRSRAALRAAAQAANYKSGKWAPNRLRFRGKSLGFLTVDNPIRWGAIYICTHGLDELALLLIFINTVMLMFYDPHDIVEYNPDGVRRQALKLGDQITSVAFALEVVLRIIAQGALSGPNAFLADGW